MNCPYCMCQTIDDTHKEVCDLNPNVQRKMKDLIGLTFKVQNLYVRITEVIPGMEKPVRATIMTYDKKNDVLTASVQSARLHYASVINRDYLDSSEYNDVANSLIEDLKRSMI